MRKGGRERERRARERERRAEREGERERAESGEGVRDTVPRQGHSGRGPAAVEGAFVFHLLVKAAVK